MTTSAGTSRAPASGVRAYLRSQWWVLAWVLVLALLYLGPALGQGFVLSYDMVFVPQQSLLLTTFGLDGGLPRAVPQDIVVALLTQVVDGAWVQKVVLLAIPIVAGLGVARLLMGWGRGVQLMGVTLAVWNPFVVERMVIGHWALLLTYAVVPWVLACLMRLRNTGRGAPGLLLWCALGSLVPTGGVWLLMVVSVPLLWPGGVLTLKRRITFMSGVVALNLPWLLAALAHPSRGTTRIDGSEAFALRAEGTWGEVLTALSLGGIWNSEVVLPSRGLILAPIMGVLLIGLTVWGIRSWMRVGERVVVVWGVLLAGAGAVLALLPALLTGLWGLLLETLPGGGLLRDSHKWLLLLAMVVAIVAPIGAARLIRPISDSVNRRVIVAALVIAPVLVLPDMAWGASGRLSAVEYPTEWTNMRQAVAEQQITGDVIVLPWSTFRRFEFNANRTVLDPAPRWLPRASVFSSSLAVTRGGQTIVISGDDPRSQVVNETLAAGQPLVGVASDLGVGLALVERNARPPVPATALDGTSLVWSEGNLELYRFPGPARAPFVTAADRVIIGVNIVIAIGLVGLGLTAAGGRWRSRRSNSLIDPDSPA